MEKPNDTVRRESLYIALFTLILCMLMNAVFLVIRMWSLPVLWGTLLGGGASCLNFFAMGLSLQKAMRKSDDTAAVKGMMRASQSVRGGFGCVQYRCRFDSAVFPAHCHRISAFA